MSYGFSKNLRILNSKEYKTIKRMGCKFVSSHFILLYCLSDKSTSRIGITVSSKFGNAVKRNKIKRLIREFFRINYKSLKYGNYVLIVKNKPLNANYLQLELCELFKRV